MIKPAEGSELRAWIQVFVTVVTAGVGVIVALGLNGKVQDLLRSRPLDLTSNMKWRSSVVGPAKWYALNFDDSLWKPARVLVLSESLSERDSAPTIWSPAESETCYLRAEFDLGRDEIDRYRIATLLAKVDDDFDLHVNGTRIATPRAEGADVTGMDIYPWLRPGKNVIAVNAWNTEGARGVSLKVTLR